MRMAPRLTPTPIPILALWERPAAAVSVGVEEAVDVVVEDCSDASVSLVVEEAGSVDVEEVLEVVVVAGFGTTPIVV